MLKRPLAVLAALVLVGLPGAQAAAQPVSRVVAGPAGPVVPAVGVTAAVPQGGLSSLSGSLSLASPLAPTGVPSLTPSPRADLSAGTLGQIVAVSAQSTLETVPAAAVEAARPLQALLKEKESLSLPADKVSVMPAGAARSAGDSIMDRILGVKAHDAPALEITAIEPQITQNLSAPSAPSAVKTSKAVPAFRLSQAGPAISLFGAAGLAAALQPLLAVAVYVTMIIPSLIIHEMAHAKVAEWLGDPNPRQEGRMSLSWRGLKTHIDLWWTLIIPIVGLLTSGFLYGGARPVKVRPGYFDRPTRGMTLVALAGPATNALLALLGAAAFGGLAALGVGGIPATVAAMFTLFNVTLAMINIIPLYPADGHHLLREALRVTRPTWLFRHDKFFSGLAQRDTPVIGRNLDKVPFFAVLIIFSPLLTLGASALTSFLLEAARFLL